MPMTQKDLESIEKIVDRSTSSLEKLFIEKLNGHGENSERHGKQIDQLYTLDRERVAEIAVIRADVVRIEGKIDTHAQVSKVEEESRDKREGAVEAVEVKSESRSQFSTATRITVALAILGPIVTAILMEAFK